MASPSSKTVFNEKAETPRRTTRNSSIPSPSLKPSVSTRSESKSVQGKKKDIGKTDKGKNDGQTAKKGNTLKTDKKIIEKDPARISPEDITKITASLVHSPFYIKMGICEQLNLPLLPPLPVSMDAVDVTDVDDCAKQYLEEIDLPGSVKLPVNVYGDGNCLPRCASILAYNTQEFHREMRLRIAVELVQHQDLYLSKDFIGKGWPENMKPAPTPIAYITTSPYYCGEDLDNPIEVAKIFNQEVNEILQNGRYMGIFQIFAAASVLQCPIVSVYPARGAPIVQRELHRLILPRDLKYTIPRFIMWTSNREMRDEYWVPNHFIVLSPEGEESATMSECELV